MMSNFSSIEKKTVFFYINAASKSKSSQLSISFTIPSNKFFLLKIWIGSVEIILKLDPRTDKFIGPSSSKTIIEQTDIRSCIEIFSVVSISAQFVKIRSCWPGEICGCFLTARQNFVTSENF